MTAFVMCMICLYLGVFSSAISHILFKPKPEVLKSIKYQEIFCHVWKISRHVFCHYTYAGFERVPVTAASLLPCFHFDALSRAAAATESQSSLLSNDVTKHFLLFWHCWPILICIFAYHISGCGILSRCDSFLFSHWLESRNGKWEIRNQEVNSFLCSNSLCPSGKYHADLQ